MLTERILSQAVRTMNGHYLNLEPVDADTATLPAPKPGKRYMLYIHIPFCESWLLLGVFLTRVIA